MQLRLYKDGESMLTKKSTKVNIITDKHRKLAYHMHRCLLEWGGIGLSAVQVGRPIRLITINAEGKKLTMFNPVITDITESTPKIEGCLSFPGTFVPRPRPENITVSYQDERGISLTGTFLGLLAQVIIHECFHLEGITFSHKDIDNPNILLYTGSNG